MVICRGTPETTHFLNVDLDIYSRSNLAPLVSALGKKVFVLHEGRDKRTYCAHLEVTRITTNADSTVRAFCALIQSLPRAERKLWDTAKFRDFNIGVQAEAQPHSHRIVLAAETVKAASEVGARIVFTVYAPEGAARAGATEARLITASAPSKRQRRRTGVNQRSR
jgi:hypothetical protein